MKIHTQEGYTMNQQNALLYAHKNYYPQALRFVRDHIVKIIPEKSPMFKWLCVIGFKIAAKNKHTLRTSMKIDIPVVEHCNLSCKCCTAFGPLAKEYFLDVASYRKDMERLAMLTNNRLESVCFTGGEPLLHPRLLEMFDIARAFFPVAELSFMTNGVLLVKMEKNFWEHCRKNKVCIGLSRYPIKLDMDRLRKTAELYKVRLDYVGGSKTPIKAMWKYPLDLAGKQPLSRSFNICNQVNSCIRMKEGKIYPCNTIACIEHFNRFFGKNLEVTKDDSIEIRNVTSIHEIYAFLIKPKPFCKYCNRAGIQLGIPWGVSKKEITEWV
ncbi:MAG: radical SAM protein [Treponema sp.]|nr:radical SAM protein [Treponema sp.]